MYTRKKIVLNILIGMGLAALTQASTITDDFNRADTTLSSDLSASMGSSWTAGTTITEGGITSNMAVVQVTEAGSAMAVNTSLASLNEATGDSFTVSGDVKVDGAGGGQWAGLVVNYQDQDNFYTLRYSGAGSVQFFRVFTGGANAWTGGSFTHTAGRSYRVTVASDTAYTFDFSITDLTDDTVVFSAADMDVGIGKHTDGFSGLYSNTSVATFDNYQLETIPEPATFGLLLTGFMGIVVLFRRKLTRK